MHTALKILAAVVIFPFRIWKARGRDGILLSNLREFPLEWRDVRGRLPQPVVTQKHKQQPYTEQQTVNGP